MAENGKFLEPMALAVACGSTIKAAAEKCNCSERQAYRIAATPAFKQRVYDIRSEVAAATVGLLTDGATKAAATVVSLLDETNEPNVRLNASKVIFAALGPMAELGELRARLDALEAASRSPKLGIAN